LVLQEKNSPRIFTTSAILNKLAKENNRPIGENSPNLVTLPTGKADMKMKSDPASFQGQKSFLSPIPSRLNHSIKDW
jgi:hypothetical protein